MTCAREGSRRDRPGKPPCANAQLTRSPPITQLILFLAVPWVKSNSSRAGRAQIGRELGPHPIAKSGIVVASKARADTARSFHNAIRNNVAMHPSPGDSGHRDHRRAIPGNLQAFIASGRGDRRGQIDGCSGRAPHLQGGRAASPQSPHPTRRHGPSFGCHDRRGDVGIGGSFPRRKF
jgi:hypothetical protein